MAATPQRLRIALMAGAVLAAAASASAQSMNANSAAYNAGWGRTAGQENQGVTASMRDANGNLVVVNGVIGGVSNQFFSGGGASTSASGAFASGATAVGNSLSVVTQGDYNTVIIDSTQINNGAVTATSTTSGGGNGS